MLRAIAAIRAADFPVLNLDLIYGLPGQTVATWLESLRTALEFAPEELYLYPLYVRPLTGLGRHEVSWDDQRLSCYRAGRDFLLAAGYVQVSMRMFRRGDLPAESGPAYCCQTDGMVGLGCGARSYTAALHYSSEYAVGASGVRAILGDYVKRTAADFAAASYGAALTADEQRRRFVLQSLLQAPGLDRAAYRARFAADALAELPALHQLAEHGLATLDAATLRLTDAGMERSDLIGPWLYPAEILARMEAFELR